MRGALLGLAVCTAAHAAVGSLTVVEGPAFRTSKGGAEQPTQQGTAVELEDTLRTGPGGHLKLTLTDQSVLVLGSDSELYVERAEFEQQDRSHVSFRLVVGAVWAQVKKVLAGSDATFEVSAARAVAGVRGTIFRVDATPLIAGTRPPKIRETVVKVAEGRVAVNALVKKAGTAAPAPTGPRHEVPGPSDITAQEWERRFVELQAGRQVRITDTQFSPGKASGKKDALDRFLEQHP
jgi:hypothetical protein